VYVGLGSNLADPEEQLNRARFELAEIPDTRLIACSGLYQSPPIGPQDQPDFLNAVAHLETRLEAAQMLRELQRIEDAHGREREVRWGARTLDLDLLLYGDEIIDTPQLQVPHPEMRRRSFVLYPLQELAPELGIPGAGTLQELMENCPPSGLKKYESE
jgi:2-amino-4-hydroxy-6-hydroxymethyldihydropteridine diphosphokinase